MPKQTTPVTISTAFVADKNNQLLLRNGQNVLEIRRSPGTPGLFPKVGLRLTQDEIRRDYAGDMVIHVSTSHYVNWDGKLKRFPKRQTK